MLISPKEMNKILQVTGSEVTNRGKRYFELGKVKITDFKYVSNKEFFAKAFVEGSVIYEVQIKKKNNMLKYKCECPIPEGRTTPCKHVLAVLFDMYTNPERYMNFVGGGKKIEEITKRKYSNLEDSANILGNIGSSTDYIKYYEDLEISSYNINEKSEIKVIPKLQFFGLANKYLAISFNLGVDKMYVLRDIFSFVDDTLNKQVASYGKGLEFKHEISAFCDSSQNILKFMIDFVSMYKSIGEFSGNIDLNKKHKSMILLKYGLLDRFFDIYQDKKIEFDEYGEIKLVSQDPIFDMDIIENESIGLNIINNSDEYYIYYGAEYAYVLYQNKLYRCSKEFQNKMLPLLEKFKKNKNNIMRVLKKDAVSFSNFVVPNIREYTNIESNVNIVEKYKLFDLGVKVYLDIDDNSNVIAAVKFCYNNEEFNPFDEEVIVKENRNIIKETKVKELFEKYHFLLNVKEKILFLKDEDSIYEFLTSGIELFMQKFEVLVTDKLKNKQIIKNKNLNLGVRVNNNLIEIDIENLNLNENELKEIFNRYKLKKKYFRLKDGSFLNLDYSSIDTLIKLKENFSVTEKEISTGKIKVPKYRAVAVDNILSNDKNINYEGDSNYKKIIRDISFNEYTEFELPKELNGNLRSYQKTGFNWLKTLDMYNFGGILADDMGLGKTIQIISLLLDNKKEGNTSIVVCPTSLYMNWESEINKFAPTLRALVISGLQKEREKIIKKISKYDVVITSYDMLKRDIELYKNLEFRFVIADEAQYIKNNNTKNALALKKLNAKTRFALTGTPIENSLSELWSIFDYIMPGYLYSYNKFKEYYEIPIVKDNDYMVKERLKNLIAPFVLRRIKREVLKELPEKTETIMYNEMEDEQRNIYDAYLADTKLKISEEMKDGEFEKNRIKILSLITRLRQICSHPSLFIDNFSGGSSKLNQCMQLLEDGISSGHKILLFSGFTSMFDIITKELDKRNIKYYMLTGKTDTSARAKMVEEFNENSDIKVFLISLKAGGTGLNLIGADMVIHYDPWWNFAVQNQATDRAHRIGQKSNVQVYKLITKNTIEEKIINLQDKKKNLLDSVISDKETFINKLSKEEIMKLFDM